MNKLLIATALALLATPALAVPRCDIPRGGEIQFDTDNWSESERTEFYQMQLRQRGYFVSSVAMWNNCVQAVTREDGALTMRYYDPWTLAEIPLD